MAFSELRQARQLTYDGSARAAVQMNDGIAGFTVDLIVKFDAIASRYKPVTDARLGTQGRGEKQDGKRTK